MGFPVCELAGKTVSGIHAGSHKTRFANTKKEHKTHGKLRIRVIWEDLPATQLATQLGNKYLKNMMHRRWWKVLRGGRQSDRVRRLKRRIVVGKRRMSHVQKDYGCVASVASNMTEGRPGYCYGPMKRQLQ